MRLRSSGLALLGAALLAAVQAQFIFTDMNDTPIQNKLYRTRAGESLKFKYSYPKDDRMEGMTISIHRGAPNQPLAEASLSYSKDKWLPSVSATATLSVDGSYGMKLEVPFSPPRAPNVSGIVTIGNAADLAWFLSSSEDRPPPPIFFDLKLRIPDANSPQIGRRQDRNPAKFGLANPALSLNESAFNTQRDRFANENGGIGGIGQEPASTVTTATPSSTGGSLQGGTLPSSTGSPSTDGGMSTGTIAGIAVGAALGVLLLGTALVWFFARRRRQNKAGKAGLGYDGGHGRSADLVAEKEANAIVAESPRSPYSEDRPHRDSTLVGGTSETAGDYQPYSDNPTATANAPPPSIAAPVARAASANSRSTADRSSAAFPASAPPPAIGEEGLPPRSDTGMSGRYAHLIEDNMTPEEIARLEEEERQLDVAIEQARGVTTK